MSPRSQVALIAVLSIGIAACSSATDGDGAKDPAKEAYLGLDTPTDGFQIRSQGATIPAGADLEYCEVAELPGEADDVYYTRSLELANGEGSHHLVVNVARPGSPADDKMRALPIGHRVACVDPEMTFGEGLEVVGGIQTPQGSVEYPSGIAKRYYGGQRVLFDYHYYNATESPIQARSAVNLHLTDGADVEQLMGTLAVVNFLIDTPPGATRAFRAEFRLKKDVMIGALIRHTHKWGGDFNVWFAGGPKDGEHIFTSKDYESGSEHPFEEPVLVKAGEGFAYECTFHNDQPRPLRFGTSSTDEMCNLTGPVWDPNGEFEGPTPSHDIVWADADGLGHTAAFEGAFPSPPEADVATCLSGAASSPSSNACAACACESCATIVLKCFTDADCGPIAQCEAPTDCTPVIDEHSSGVGTARQLGACVQTRCAAECGAG